MKTNYAGHDRVYQKHRAQGHLGWDASETEYAQFKTHVDGIIARGNAPKSGRLLELGCGCLTPPAICGRSVGASRKTTEYKNVNWIPACARMTGKEIASLRSQ